MLTDGSNLQGKGKVFLWLSKKKISQLSISDVTGIPLGQENLEKWECIFQSGKSKGILNRPEKVRENHSKYWKSQGISDKCYLLFFSDIQMNCVLFAKLDQFFSSTNIKYILEKMEKITG